MNDSSFNVDFLDILLALSEAGADYVIVGAHAMAVHGVPRATGDLDLLIRPTTDNAEQALEALRQFGAPVDQHGVTATDLARPGTVYQIGLPPRRIDILTQVSGLEFDEVWASRIEVDIEGMTVHVIGREALARNKRAAGRDKDLVDLRTLETQADR